MTELLDLGVDTIRWVSELRTPALTELMLVVTDLGSTAGYLALLPILWWGVSWKLGARVFTVLVASVYLNSVLKDLVALPRPFVYADVDNLRVPSSMFSFPSGHAQQAAVFWGLLAAHFRHVGLTTFAAVIVFLIGASRVYLGVHYPTDVVAGWVIGGAFVWAATRYGEQFHEKARALPFSAKLSAACTVPALLTLVHPESNITIAMGGVAGALAGCVVAMRLGLYPEHGNGGVRRPWLLVGVAGLPVVVSALRLSDTGYGPSLTVQWFRFAALGLWVSFVVPWLARIALRRAGP